MSGLAAEAESGWKSFSTIEDPRWLVLAILPPYGMQKNSTRIPVRDEAASEAKSKWQRMTQREGAEWYAYPVFDLGFGAGG